MENSNFAFEKHLSKCNLLKEFGTDILKLFYPLTFPITGDLPYQIRDRIENRIGKDYREADALLSILTNFSAPFLFSRNEHDFKIIGVIVGIDSVARIFYSFIHKENSKGEIEFISKIGGTILLQTLYEGGIILKDKLKKYVKSLEERVNNY